MWVYLGDIENNTSYINEELKRIKATFKKAYWDIFFQFWVTDLLDQYSVKMLDDEWFSDIIKNKRLENEKLIVNNLWLLPSFRENMPLATVSFDLSLREEDLRKSISKSARNHINKAKSRGLSFGLIEKDDEWLEFYDIWYQTAKVKWFHIIDQKLFLALKAYIISNRCWNLFLARKDWKIVSWSLCFFFDKNIIYMYWATNREFWNVWGHQFLKYEMFKWWWQNGFVSADLLWVSPTWFKWHHLDWVTSFKQSLGWTKIEYVGNYDLVFNKLLYKIFHLSKK